MLILMTQTEIQKISLSVSLSLYISLITMNYSGSVLIRFLLIPSVVKASRLLSFLSHWHHVWWIVWRGTSTNTLRSETVVENKSIRQFTKWTWLVWRQTWPNWAPSGEQFQQLTDFWQSFHGVYFERRPRRSGILQSEMLFFFNFIKSSSRERSNHSYFLVPATSQAISSLLSLWSD